MNDLTQIFEIYCLLGAALFGTQVCYIKFVNFARYSLIVEFFQLIFVSLLCFTIWADYYFEILVFQLSLFVYLLKNHDKTRDFSEEEKNYERFCELTGKENAKSDTKKPEPNLTIIHIKSYCIILTIICILAVDFPSIYPKRHEKSQNYGYTAMDTGAGIIVYGSGLAFGVSQRKTLNNNDIIQVISCVILGVIRVVTVKSLEYQEKVEEYGVYWNFFFTMAVIKVFSEMFLRKSNVALESLRAKLWRSPTFLVPVLLPIFYEILLNLEFDFEYFIGPGEKSTKMTLKHAIMDLPHQTEQKINFLANFFLQNREGIFSSLGYFSIYCYGNLLSNLYFRGQKSDTRETGPNLKYKFLNLSLFMTFLVLPISVKFIDSGSRRLGNLTFVVWMYGINAMFLYFFGLGEVDYELKTSTSVSLTR